MADLTLQGSGSTPVTTNLQRLLLADDIVPGAAPSYELCKIIYEYHPLGLKMVEAPTNMAQSQPREISVAIGPEDRLREAFLLEWNLLNCDDAAANLMRISRIYGAGSLGILTEGETATSPLKYEELYKKNIAFNIWDPLNTSGSLVLNQLPNSFEFLKHESVRVSGQEYHPSRVIVKFNEKPIYLGWTASAFGYVGRSVYQRALYPLKSFINTMVTDDMISRKAGVLVMKLKQAGSIVSQSMLSLFGLKRQVLQDAATNNVISVGQEDAIESLNLQNIDGAGTFARTNILKNIATSADMPAILLENETLVEGFGEGTEDAKVVARYVERYRTEMTPIYMFLDQIVQYRAWNPDFYKTLQAAFPETYGGVDYKVAFYEWRNNFKAVWPSLLTEPDSEKIKVDDTRLKAVIALVEVLMPSMDPENKAVLIQWAADNFNELPLLFTTPLELDYEALAAYEPMDQLAEVKPEAPFSAHDAAIAPAALLTRLADRVRRIEHDRQAA